MATTLKNLLAGFFFVAALNASDVSATEITYNFNASSGSDSIIGVVTTDGKLGTLTSSDIVSFDLVISSQVGVNTGTAEISSATGGSFLVYGSDLTATATGLYYNFLDPYFPLSEILVEAAGGVPFAVLGDEYLWGSTVGGTIAVGFSATYGASNLLYTGSNLIATTPVPETLPLLMAGLGIFGWLGRRWKMDRPAI